MVRIAFSPVIQKLFPVQKHLLFIWGEPGRHTTVREKNSGPAQAPGRKSHCADCLRERLDKANQPANFLKSCLKVKSEAVPIFQEAVAGKFPAPLLCGPPLALGKQLPGNALPAVIRLDINALQVSHRAGRGAGR